MCGAGWRNSIFSLLNIAKPEPAKYESVVGEQYIGCFVDTGKRDLPTFLREGYGNYKKCFEAADKKKFAYAGLQYSGECWVGNEYGKYGQKPDSECNMECKNDKGKKCGAGWRNSVFNLEGVDTGSDGQMSKGLVISNDFTYQERQLILMYIRMHLRLITQ
jgi:hypothetical protein